VPGLEVVHQAGRDRDAEVRAAYAREGVACATVAPFLDDVARAVANADVVIARAGASTLGELTAVGRAAILVPYPHAAADHQGRNAEALARAGGAVCIRQNDATPERLARELETLLRDDAARIRMAEASRARGRPAASTDVASDLLDLAGIARRPRPSSTNGSTRGTRTAAQEAR
jgi:UDP-N-acetylglucosamine--N-acetylmuramyl-(pentapeptide) pyrophosphoryl-undecaprenol N-acetylglucosamine transferase